MECNSGTCSNPADLERVQQDKMIENNLSKIRRKILVMSGKGGVGKSTVAGYIALLLSKKGYKVGLLEILSQLNNLFLHPMEYIIFLLEFPHPKQI